MSNNSNSEAESRLLVNYPQNVWVININTGNSAKPAFVLEAHQLDPETYIVGVGVIIFKYKTVAEYYLKTYERHSRQSTQVHFTLDQLTFDNVHDLAKMQLEGFKSDYSGEVQDLIRSTAARNPKARIETGIGLVLIDSLVPTDTKNKKWIYLS